MHAPGAETAAVGRAADDGSPDDGSPDAVEIAARVLGDLARRDVPLAPFTTYKVGGAAALHVSARSHDDLRLVARAVRRSGLPLLVVGRGSNLLVSDAGFRGVALSVVDMTSEVDLDVSSGVVEAGSAVRLPVLARQTVRAGLTGFEWAVGVPGSIGGAVRMNAGGHGSDMSESLVDVRVCDLSDVDAPVRVVPAGDLGLRFRGSDLDSDDVVLSARLQLAPGDPEDGERELGEIVAWRRTNQPGGQNAGSVFVNPVPGEVSAGALIDGVGLRGMRMGRAFVSDKHANFIQADPDGSADDVVALMRHVRATVLERTGHALRSEIQLVGFGDDPWA